MNPPPAKPAHATSCPKCGAWWTGINTAHCMAENCHRTFTTVAAFDAHRAGSHSRDTRHCVNPESIVIQSGPRKGQPAPLVDASRAYPCWGFPGAEGEWWKNAPGGDAA